MKSESTWPVLVHCSSRVGRDREIGLVDGFVFFQKPTPHPAGGRDATGPGEAVLLVRFKQVYPLAEPEPAVDQLHLAKRVPAPFDVEEVAGADREQGRLGSAEGHEIGVLQPGGDAGR